VDHQINNIHEPRSKGIIREMILKVCDILPVLTVKTVMQTVKTIMQTDKGRGDAPLSLIVTEEKLIICKASCSPIIAS